MKTPAKLSDELLAYLKENYQYNPTTGEITHHGKVVGSQKNTGHIVVMIYRDQQSRQIYAHRLAWFLHYGEDPTLLIDHIDGNPSNNTIDNLRLVTNQQNIWNRRKLKSFSSSFKGVSLSNHLRKGVALSKRWRASIMYQGKQIHIGYFENEKDAALAYDTRAKELYGEYAKLNFPA